jgi:alpha-tubulin suppressor-like RCC1 family protein
VTTATSIATGWGHSCAILGDGTAMCWGHYNAWGQIGDGTTADTRLLPVAVVNFAAGVGMVAGSYHTCASTAAGALFCWGNNQSGELGLGARDDGRHTSNQVPGLTNVVEVTAGGGHTCARMASGAVSCWGYGPIGDGANTTAYTPAPVKGLTDAVSLMSGEDHACARRANGKIVCWGSDSAGQLGDGFKVDQLAPVEVVGLP